MFEAKTNLKTAIFFADGCEEIEGLTVITQSTEVTSSHEVTFRTDTTIGELDFDQYDMIILPGGIPGTPNLRACSPLMEQVKAFCEKGRQVAAICAAPSILAELGLLSGVRATCNPSKDEVLKESGTLLCKDKVVVSNNIITSRGMGTAIPFGLAIVAHYLGEDKARALGENIIYY